MCIENGDVLINVEVKYSSVWRLAEDLVRSKHVGFGISYTFVPNFWTNYLPIFTKIWWYGLCTDALNRLMC